MAEDLSQKIEALLASPDGMAKIGQVMAALGQAPKALPDTEAQPSLPPALVSLLGQSGGNDRDAQLLHALRPYLHGERQERLSAALRVLELKKFLPLLEKGGGFR